MLLKNTRRWFYKNAKLFQSSNCSSFWLQHIFIQEVVIWWVENGCKGMSAFDVTCLYSYSEWNPEACYRSISKCWRWWDFPYSWWNIFKMHNNSIYFRCFKLVLWWWLEVFTCSWGFSVHAHKSTKRKIQQKGLCKVNFNVTYLLGSFVEIISIFKEDIVTSKQRKRIKNHKKSKESRKMIKAVNYFNLYYIYRGCIKTKKKH